MEERDGERRRSGARGDVRLTIFRVVGKEGWLKPPEDSTL